MREVNTELQHLGTATRRGVLVVLLWATAAAAQVTQVPQGHVLDANPGVGGGMSNAPVNGYVPVNGNDIITGNVTGLGRFHGTIPYRSPYEFHGAIVGGSSAVNSFARQSSGGSSSGQMRTFYTPSKLVSSQGGTINPGLASANSLSGMSISLQGPSTVNPTNALGANAQASNKVALLPPSQSFDYGKIGSQSLIPAAGSDTIDPLFGLQRTLALEPVPMATPAEPTNQNPNLRMRTVAREDGALGGGGRNDNKLNERDRPKMPLDRGFVEQVSDQRIDKPVDASQVLPQTGRTLNALQTPQFDRGIRVSESFQTVLDGLRENTGPGLRFEPAGLNANGTIPDSTRFTLPGSTQTPKPEAGGTGPGGVDPLTGQPWKSGHADAKLTQSVDPTKGNYRPRTFNNKVPGDEVEEGGKAGQPAVKGGPTTRPASSLSRTPPTITSLLIRADEQVQAGQYLRAAETYQSALRLEPTSRTALIGRANAELAAGMYETAAYDLKFLYTQDPAQLTNRFHLPSLLPAKRLEFLEKDLLEFSTKKDQTPAVFLLTYLYYQLERPDDLRAQLKLWTERWPGDPWPAILQKAWLEEPKPTAPAKP